jgi:hypothetical protein
MNKKNVKTDAGTLDVLIAIMTAALIIASQS